MHFADMGRGWCESQHLRKTNHPAPSHPLQATSSTFTSEKNVCYIPLYPTIPWNVNPPKTRQWQRQPIKNCPFFTAHIEKDSPKTKIRKPQKLVFCNVLFLFQQIDPFSASQADSFGQIGSVSRPQFSFQGHCSTQHATVHLCAVNLFGFRIEVRKKVATTGPLDFGFGFFVEKKLRFAQVECCESGESPPQKKNFEIHRCHVVSFFFCEVWWE